VSKKQVKPVITDHMQTEFEIESDKWEEIFMLSKVIQDTKIRTFQYKILFSFIPCNLYLKHIKRSDTDKCFKCNNLDDIISLNVKKIKCFGTVLQTGGKI
jgi:hypothetical protein